MKRQTSKWDGHKMYTLLQRFSTNMFLALSLFLFLVIGLGSCGGGGGGGGGSAVTPPVTTALPGAGVYGSPQSVTLAADKPATIYYSTNGNMPSIGGTNTISGPSPVTNIQISSDSTLLQFFAVDSLGNRESVKSEVYVVSTGGATGPGDAQNYFPLNQGNTWNYQVTFTETGSPTSTYPDSTQITGTTVINGVTAVVSRESNLDNSGITVEEYLLKNSNGIAYLGNNDQTDKLTPQIIPYQIALFPLQTGASFVQANKARLDYGEDLDLDGKNETADLNSIVTVKGFETETVPVGSFPNSARVETDASLSVTLSSDNTKIAASTVQTQWFSLGIGPVKSVTATTASNFNSTETEELIGYYVNGQGKGILPQFTLASGVANANSDTETPGKSAISFDGTNYLFVSCRNVGSPSGLYGVIISGAGAGKILNTFQILSQSCQFPRPAVAFDGTNYLVVFQQNGQIFGTRVSSSGNVLDGPSGFGISSGTPNVITNFSPAIAFDGTNYLVVWQKYNGGYDIYGSEVTTSGQVLGEFPISQAPGEQVEPSIAFDGNNYMVVWRDARNGVAPNYFTDIYGERITKGGIVLDPAGIPISTAPANQGEPQIIYDGTNYFVVWIDQRNSLSSMHSDIYGTRSKTDGTLLDGSPDTGAIAINNATNDHSYVSVTFDGANYFVVWAVANFSSNPPAGIFAARVSTNGGLIDGPSTGAGISISGLPPSFSRYVYPVILFNGKNSLLAWVNNIELSGATKDIDGIVIYPY